MGEYFKNKYRVNSIRLNHWDYSCPAMYFVTICTHNRRCCLGEIKNDRVYLSEIGQIVHEELLNTAKLRPYVILDDFIIMPNHLHVIFVIGDNNFGAKNRKDAPQHVFTVNKFAPLQTKSLPSIVNHFKGAVKNRCNKINLAFAWQGEIL